MASAWEKIEITFKKMQPQIKKLDAGKADKQLKTTKAALESAWDEEEKFIDALKTAKKAGLEGKKPADFMGDPGFKKSHAALTKMAKAHADAVKLLQAGTDDAKAMGKPLTKLLADIKKEMTRGDKEHLKLQKEVEAAEKAAVDIARLVGKLTPPELFYGPQIVRVVEKIINKDKKKDGPKGGASELIEEKELAKNVKKAKKLSKEVIAASDDVLKKVQKDPKKAEAALKAMVKLCEELEAINEAYQKVKKKDAKSIKEAKNKSKIDKSIKDINKTRDKACDASADAHEAVDDMPDA